MSAWIHSQSPMNARRKSAAVIDPDQHCANNRHADQRPPDDVSLKCQLQPFFHSGTCTAFGEAINDLRINIRKSGNARCSSRRTEISANYATELVIGRREPAGWCKRLLAVDPT